MGKPPLDARAHDLPWLAGAAVGLEVGEPQLELSPLGVGQRQIDGVGGDAIPEVFGQLDALGHGEFAEL